MPNKFYRVQHRRIRYIRRVLSVAYMCGDCGRPLCHGSRNIGLCHSCYRRASLPLRFAQAH